MSSVKSCTASPGRSARWRTSSRPSPRSMKDKGHEPLRVLTDVTGEPFWTSSQRRRWRRSRTSSPGADAHGQRDPPDRRWLTITSSWRVAVVKSIASRVEVLEWSAPRNGRHRRKPGRPGGRLFPQETESAFHQVTAMRGAPGRCDRFPATFEGCGFGEDFAMFLRWQRLG